MSKVRQTEVIDLTADSAEGRPLAVRLEVRTGLGRQAALTEALEERTFYNPAPVPLGQDHDGNWVYYEIDLAPKPEV